MVLYFIVLHCIILFNSILARIFLPMIKTHDQNQLGEERVFFQLTQPGHTPLQREVREGAQGRNPEAGVEAEAMEETVTDLFPHGILSILSHTTQNYLPGVASSTMGWAILH